jgi:hypothetical protein
MTVADYDRVFALYRAAAPSLDLYPLRCRLAFMKKKLLVAVVVPVVMLATVALGIPKDYDPVTLWRAAPIATGYAAKMLCTGVFVSGLDPKTMWDQDLKLMRDNTIRGGVDPEKKTATARALGFLFKRTAVYRGPCGCTLELPGAAPDFSTQCNIDLPAPPPDIAFQPWPTGDAPGDTTPPPGLDRAKLDAALDWAFDETRHPIPVHTRAVIVIYDGKIVAERYASGITADTRLLGWSMSKSVNSALVGILVGRGKLDVRKPAPVPEWQTPGDPRAKITIENLLHMDDGLDFAEVYENKPDDDAGYMFFTVPDMAAYAAAKPAKAPPGMVFNYSSGTTMLLARIVRRTVGGTFADYLAFSRRELFNKIGMRSALVEPDPSGTMVGAGFTYATARDWARFGLLYYYDGVWNGERILPEGWVAYTRTPGPTTGEYGAQWWLNADRQWWPDCPEDLYSAWGHEGQFVTIVPSRKTIVVRLGQTFDEENNWDRNYFVAAVLKAMPPD